MLKAVNLGEHTDKVGTVAGALAGTYYGIVQSPKKEWIIEISNKMVHK